MKSQLSLLKRPRRNRKSEGIRNLVQENFLTPHDLIAPYFVTPGKRVKSPISSLPGQFHMSGDELLNEVETLISLGIRTLMLFPVVPPEVKDKCGSHALSTDNHLFRVIEMLKTKFPSLTLIGDIALDPFTTHGHDGLLTPNGEVENDSTVEVLCEMSVLYARAGIDIVAPSDMMDGRVEAIRKSLDSAELQDVSIMSYTAKYASALYKPFREALGSAPQFGDKKSYQMNPANSREALLEASLDEKEGADFLMVKPASLYLDIIQLIRANSALPIVAYHVSGEYAMLKAAAEKKWLDFEHMLYEILLGIKRSGADLIISYGAKEVAKFLRSSTELPHMETTGK